MKDPNWQILEVKTEGWEAGFQYRFRYWKQIQFQDMNRHQYQVELTQMYEQVKQWVARQQIPNKEYKLFRSATSVYLRINDRDKALLFRLEH